MFNVGSIGFWLPLYARDLGLPYSQVTWLATIYFSVLLPATLAAGIAADVTGRPRLLVAGGLALTAISSLGLASADSFPELAALRGLQALGLATVLPLSVGALTRVRGVREGVGVAAALQGAGMALGALAGGGLYGSLGWPPVALFYAAAASAAAVAVALSEAPPRPARPVGPREVARALAAAPPGVKVVLAALLARNAFATGAYSILSVIFARLVGLSALSTGLALAVNPAVQALAAGPVTRISRGREAALYSLGIIITGVVLHAYAEASTALHVVAAQALQGLGFSMINVSANNYIISRMPPETRYTAASLFPLAFNAGWILGTAAAGPFMDLLGVRAWLYIAGAACYALGLATPALLILAEPRGGARRGGQGDSG